MMDDNPVCEVCGYELTDDERITSLGTVRVLLCDVHAEDYRDFLRGSDDD